MAEELKEKLAELAHDQWAGWMDYLFSKCRESRPTDGDAFNEECLIIPPWAVERWKRQASTPYDELSEEEKDSDRTEADKFLKVMESRQPDNGLVDALEKIAKGEADQLCNDGITRKSSLTYMQLTMIALEALAKHKGD